MAYEVSCRDLDHTCNWKGRAGSEDALLADLANHVQKVHQVKRVTDTIVNFAKLKIRQT